MNYICFVFNLNLIFNLLYFKFKWTLIKLKFLLCGLFSRTLCNLRLYLKTWSSSIKIPTTTQTSSWLFNRWIILRFNYFLNNYIFGVLLSCIIFISEFIFFQFLFYFKWFIREWFDFFIYLYFAALRTFPNRFYNCTDKQPSKLGCFWLIEAWFFIQFFLIYILRFYFSRRYFLLHYS